VGEEAVGGPAGPLASNGAKSDAINGNRMIAPPPPPLLPLPVTEGPENDETEPNCSAIG
jgi:hypothetical protein